MTDAQPKKTILVVDDTPANIALLLDALKPDYRTKVANNGEKALALAAMPDDRPDLILLDIMMPGMSGYEVCERLKADPAARDIPVIFVTAMGETEDEERGLALGGVDYVTKPVSPPIVRARVRTHLDLAEQRRTLAGMVMRMRRFFSPAVADLILTGHEGEVFKPRRREIAVVFLDLRNYTAFTETAEPEDVMGVLAEYHAAMGELIVKHRGTLERFGGDSLMIFFNDPEPMDDPAGVAVAMALEMRERVIPLAAGWKRRGFDLSIGIGIAQGYATIGAIGFEGRRDYGAIGTVTNLAARLCSEAEGGQIVISQRVFNNLGGRYAVIERGALALKGFHRPMAAWEVTGPAAGA